MKLRSKLIDPYCFQSDLVEARYLLSTPFFVKHQNFVHSMLHSTSRRKSSSSKASAFTFSVSKNYLCSLFQFHDLNHMIIYKITFHGKTISLFHWNILLIYITFTLPSNDNAFVSQIIIQTSLFYNMESIY